MKKALQSIVLLGATTGVAQAATSVTLYGLVDGGIAYSQAKLTHEGTEFLPKFTRVVRDVGMKNGILNGNRWGLKGTEDLGNGTSVIFKIESGFDLGDGKSKQGGSLFGRQAIVGLTGNSWGTLTLGRQHNVADDVVSGLDPFRTGVLFAGVTDGAFGGSPSARMSNSIKYMIPDLSGFKFGLAYSGTHNKVSLDGGKFLSETTRDTSNWMSTGLGYANGPIEAGVSYDRYRVDTRTVTTNAGTVTENKNTSSTSMWNLFGTYDFEVVKLHLGYGRIRGAIAKDTPGVGLNGMLAQITGEKDGAGKVGRPNYTQTSGFRQQSWMAGLSAPVSDSGTVLFSYQGNTSKNNTDDYDGVKGKLNIFSLGYVQGLSKRTRVYAAASYAVGKLNTGKYELEVNGLGDLKQRVTLISAGLQHRF